MSDYQCPFCKNHHTTERAENIEGGLQLLLDAACEVIRKNKMKSDGSDR